MKIIFQRQLQLVKALVSAIGLTVIAYNPAFANSPVWSVVSDGIASAGSAQIDSGHIIQVDSTQLAERLSRAGKSKQSSIATLTIPLSGGGLETFRIWETVTMESGLYDWMLSQGHDMRTYAGESLDRPGYRLAADWGGPHGFHAMVTGGGESYKVVPQWAGDTLYYGIKRRNESESGYANGWRCSTINRSGADRKPQSDHARVARTSRANRTGGALRTYRLAIATTGEFSKNVSNNSTNKADTLAQIITVVNEVNDRFIPFFSIKLILVNNNDKIIFTDPNTDPYQGQFVAADAQTNQSVIDREIGAANYDIGHVFTDDQGQNSGGGSVIPSSVCVNGIKADGGTSLLVNDNGPMINNGIKNNTFMNDFVAHEIGHQFSANHTYNACAPKPDNQRAANSAYEPGSGLTIMGYAGTCNFKVPGGGGQDNDLGSSSYFNFHSHSVDEILNFTSSGAGAACAVMTNPGGNPNTPTVDAGPDFTIPANTKFELTALKGFDPDPDAKLKYTWEQFDLGPERNLSEGDTGEGPIIAPSQLVADPTYVVRNNLPTVTRANNTPVMNFRTTIYDNDPDGGRVSSDTMKVTIVANGAGQFAVTLPNGGENFTTNGMGNTQNITWNTGGTQNAPVNTGNVDIFLKEDPNSAWLPVLRNAPNSGAALVTLPPPGSTNAWIKVKGRDNIFFDDTDGTIRTGLGFRYKSNAATVSIGDSTVVEGDAGTTNLNFPVMLSAAQGAPTTIFFRTRDGTATSNSDFVSINKSSIKIPAGVTTGTITVVVNGDGTAEFDETMSVDLDSANNGIALGKTATGIGTITNDDIPPASVSIANAAFNEGNSGAANLNFTVTQSAARATPTTVTFSTADGTATVADNDYTAINASTVTIPANALTATISISVNGDTTVEPDESFTVTLTASDNGVTIGAPATATGSINNDDTAAVAADSGGGGGGGGGCAMNRQADKRVDPLLLLVMLLSSVFVIRKSFN